jgi:hypothetical protein
LFVIEVSVTSNTNDDTAKRLQGHAVHVKGVNGSDKRNSINDVNDITNIPQPSFLNGTTITGVDSNSFLSPDIVNDN